MSRRLLLTGAGGFVGSHVLRHILASTAWEVVCPVTFTHRGLNDRIRLAMDAMPEAAARVQVVRCDLTTPISTVTDHRFGPIDYVLNLASESHVDRSITDPADFVVNNVALMTRLLDWMRIREAEGRGPEVFVQVSTDEVYGPAPAGTAHREWVDGHRPSNPYSASKAAQEDVAFAYWRTYDLPLVVTNCWDMDTRILTVDGPRTHDEVQVGDLVWTVDADERMVLEPVKAKVRMPSGGRMIRFSGHTDQLVTPNHRMMFRESSGKARVWGPIVEAHAEDLAEKVPSGAVQFVRNADWIGDTTARYCTGDLIERRTGRGGNDLPDELSASWLARFFGWWVTEGSRTGTQVRLAGVKPGQQNVFRDLLSEVGMGRVGADKGAVYVSSKELASLTQLSGGLQSERRIPSVVKAMGEEYLQEFLAAAIAGDGTWYGSAARIYTMSEDLAYDYAEVGMKCGYSAKVSSRVTKSFDSESESRTWYVNLAARVGSTITPANISEEPYDGDVWCVSVPSGRVFTTRNEGGIVLTGQTMNIIGETQDPEKYVPMVLRRVLAGEEVTIHTSPSGQPGSRFYLHARNQADGLLHVLHHVRQEPHNVETGESLRYSMGGDTPHRYHIVGEREVDNLELARMIATYAGRELQYRRLDFHSSRPGHDLRYALDGSKMAATGWKPPVPLEESLRRAVEWTMAHPEWLEVGNG